jgi:hypothetical protein
MRLSTVWGALLALVVALSSAAAAAATDDKATADKGGKPDAVDMIFEHKHLANVDAGKELIYKFHRIVSDPKLLGEPFADDITLKIVAAKPDGGRDVDLQIYTGDRARDLQQMPDRLHNPLFLVYFNQAVNTFSQLAGGQRPYLTRAFSTGFKDKSKIEPVKVDYNGKKIDAYRITMAPYVGDQNESKMQGWEGAEYVVVLSDQVPGEVVDLIAKYKNKYKGELTLVERTTLDGASGLEDTK